MKLNSVEDVKPKLDYIERSQSTFGTTSITYNDTVTQYSSSSDIYAGSDRIQGAAPMLQVINEEKSKLLTEGVGELVPSLKRIRDEKPSLRVVDDASMVGTVTLYAGMPMGLLLTVTYPTTTSYEI